MCALACGEVVQVSKSVQGCANLGRSEVQHSRIVTDIFEVRYYIGTSLLPDSEPTHGTALASSG